MCRITKAHCNTCGGERNHDILHSEKKNWQDDEAPVHGSDTYETLRCRGCEEIKLRHTSMFSEHQEDDVHYFPPLVFRRRPEWFEDLYFEVSSEEEFVESLLNEIYVAVQNNLLNLALMGVRSLIEKVMIAKVGDNRSFAKNLNAFASKGFVSIKQKENLSTILEAGHAAIHRKYNPRENEVITVLDITEHIIESVYLHESKVSNLKKRVPQRVPKND
ncbi:DUF4145 domain-containing protein [Shewanella sp. SG44-2]|jgi:hypothetical protein|uniref:DUF4145 domain-containing protein n=1 Tax=Shewanella sp. SG44-2 TaxID=2760962 RepID=UPI0016036E17|nr:DUF4145 domain-containing protein [Shewanella sp. SG44-2]MBB1425431.1 DUF4145 domain-containing protein [Shewanella sp. SG44-2]